MFLMKPFSSLLGIGLLVFIGWIAIGGQPTVRIERFCSPVSWTGNIVTSLFELGAPSIVPYISNGFSNTEYGCRYATWRVLYEKDWVAAQQAQAAEMQQQEQEQEQTTPQQLVAQPEPLEVKQTKAKHSHKEGAPK